MFKSHSSNITTTIQISLLSSLFLLLCWGSAFDASLYILSNGNPTLVRVAASLVVLTQLGAVVPAALTVDAFDRANVAKSIAVLLAVGFGVFVTGLAIQNIPVILFGAAFIAILLEFSSTTSESVFLDSISRGQRLAPLTRKAAIKFSGSAIATTLLLFFFLFNHQEWRIQSCISFVLISSLFLLPLIGMELWKLKDPRGVTEGRTPEKAYSKMGVNSHSLLEPLTSEISETKSQINETYLSRLTGIQSWVPVLVVISGIAKSIASGMTLRYLYINQVFDCSVAVLFLISICQLMLMMGFTWLSPMLSKVVGRGWCSALYSLIGTPLFVLLMVLPSQLLFLHSILLGLQYGIVAVDQSIIADTTQTSHRGKWVSIQNLSSLTWFACSLVAPGMSSYRVLSFAFVSYCLSTIAAIGIAFNFPQWLDVSKSLE